MTRLVDHDASGPVRLDESDIDERFGDIAICRCGLSADPPFCDGSHKRTEGEDDDVLYRYENGERYPVDVVRREE